MFFKNLLIYTLTKPEVSSWPDIEEALKTKQATPCASNQMHSYGFTAPYNKGTCPQLAYMLDDFILIAARKEERILPTSVIKKEVQAKVDEIETRDNRKVYLKEKSQLQDEVINKLMPQAFIREKTTYAAIVLSKGLIYVDASSTGESEKLLSLLREALGTLSIKPLTTNINPDNAMTSWLLSRKPPHNFYILGDCELHDIDNGIIRCKQQDLSSEEITTLLESGMIATKLALSWQGKLSFLLDKKLNIKRIKFEDILLEQAEHDGGNDAFDYFNASLIITIKTFNEILPDLLASFGGEEEHASINKPSNVFDQFVLYEEAVSIVKASGNAGVSHLQRQLKIGYNHASILIERMERESIVSVEDSRTGKRTVLP